jgi:hypothetical protein
MALHGLIAANEAAPGKSNLDRPSVGRQYCLFPNHLTDVMNAGLKATH